MEKIKRSLQYIVIAFIKAYQYLLSPLLGPRCRFTPSCSSYATLAIERFGVWRGIGLTLKRLSRCHPWHEGGYDPIPNKTQEG